MLLGFALACGGDGGTDPDNNGNGTPPRVASVQFSSDTVALQIGGEIALRPTLRNASGVEVTGVAVTYAMSVSGVIATSSLGVVTAVGAGIVTLTATADGHSDSIVVVVVPPILSLQLSPTNFAVVVGQNTQLTVTFRDAQSAVVQAPLRATWVIQDSAVVSVSSTGRITGRASGSTRVTASLGSVQASVVVRVVTQQEIGTISFGLSQYGIIVGQGRDLPFIVRDTNGVVLPIPVTWSSSSPTVATISEPPRVTGRAAGSATISAGLGPVSSSVPFTVFDSATAGSLGGTSWEEEFLFVAAGSFQNLTLANAIRVQRTEVTQQQWLSVLPTLPPGQSVICSRCPVEEVTAALAAQFIAALNAAQPGRGYRLPTEVEWEFFARGRSATGDFHGDLELVAWYAATMSGSRPSQVALRQPNAVGLYDIHGNVAELTGNGTVWRGGGWKNAAAFQNLSFRCDPNASPPCAFDSAEGIRLVRNP